MTPVTHFENFEQLTIDFTEWAILNYHHAAGMWHSKLDNNQNCLSTRELFEIYRRDLFTEYVNFQTWKHDN